MEIWLDTVDIKTIKSAHDCEILHGVTTNPSLLATSSSSLMNTLTEILNAQEGPLAVQAVGDTVQEMLNHARKIFKISSRIIVKIPVSKVGFQVMHHLHEEGIPVMATAIFEPYQAFMALKLDAAYIAPYLGRIADQGKDPADFLKAVHQMQKAYGFEGKILGAGIRSLDHFSLCAVSACEAITIPKKVYEALFETHPATKRALEEFERDWELVLEKT